MDGAVSQAVGGNLVASGTLVRSLREDRKKSMPVEIGAGARRCDDVTPCCGHRHRTVEGTCRSAIRAGPSEPNCLRVVLYDVGEERYVCGVAAWVDGIETFVASSRLRAKWSPDWGAHRLHYWRPCGGQNPGREPLRPECLQPAGQPGV